MIEWISRIRLNRKIWGKVYVTDTVMDIGCGMEPQRFFKPKHNILCEPNHAYAAKLTSIFGSMEDHEIREVTAGKIAAEYPDNMVDSVFMLDVLEHLEKEEGLAILARLPKIARKQVIIRVPIGWVEQDYTGMTDPWGFEENESQTHLSAWLPEEFDDDWEVLASDHYQFIEGNGTISNPPEGTMYAILNINTAGLQPVKMRFMRQMVITLYDCGIIATAAVLRLLPKSWSRRLVRFVMRTVWRRLGA